MNSVGRGNASWMKQHYRAARVTVTEHACVFEKALLARCADCRLAARHALAEREAIGCRSPAARADCGTLFALLRERSAFALKTNRMAEPLPHAQTMRLQCGGIGWSRAGNERGGQRRRPRARRGRPGPVWQPWRIAVARHRCLGRRVAGPRPASPSMTPNFAPPAGRGPHQLPYFGRAARPRTDAVHLPARNARDVSLGARHRARRAAAAGRGRYLDGAAGGTVVVAGTGGACAGPGRRIGRGSLRRRARQSRAGRAAACLRRRHRAPGQAAVLPGGTRARGMARRRAGARRRSRIRARHGGGAGRHTQRHDLRAAGIVAALALGTRRSVDGQARRRRAQVGARRLWLRRRPGRRHRPHDCRRRPRR